LKKRENYRRAFAGFDVQRVAEFGDEEVERLIQNAGIIRNRAKILAAISNAQHFLEIQNEFGSFDRYIWGFVNGGTIVNKVKTIKDYPATSPESDALSKDLRKRGFKFIGSTTCYANMQAIGMVNDHSLDCYRRAELLGG
jgi:DNA-3-methyladenine glycosylase I